MEHCLKLGGREERKTDSHMDTAGQMRRHQGPHFSPGYVSLTPHTLSHTHIQSSMYILSSVAPVFFLPIETLETHGCIFKALKV